jgi:hypothetical protein
MADPLFAYDASSQQLVIFPPAVDGAPKAFKIADLQKAGWMITEEDCAKSLPRAQRADAHPGVTLASAQDLRNLKRH